MYPGLLRSYFPGNNSGSATATVQPAASADLAVELTGPSDPVTVGGNLTYTIQVTNNGPSSTVATLTDTLPAGVTFVSATGGVTPGGGILTFDLGTLAGGDQATVTIVVTPTAAGMLTDSATTSGSVADSDTSNNAASRATTVAAAPPPKLPDLAVAIIYDQDSVTLGQDLGYTITVNNGGAAGATGVTLTDSLPPGVAFVQATGGVVPIEGVLTFHLGDLAGGGETEVKVVVTPTATGSLSTTAGVAANEPESGSGSDTATGSTTVVDPSPSPGPTSGPSPTPTSSPSPTPTPGASPGGPLFVGDGPRVVRFQRFGFHSQPTWLVLTFDRALDPARATDIANYSITGPRAGGHSGPRAQRRVSIESIRYDPGTRTVSLHTKGRLDLHHPYQLVVAGTGLHGLADPSGTMLDGDGNGRPGGDCIVRVIDTILAGRANDAGPLFGSTIPLFRPVPANPNPDRPGN